MRAKPAFAVDIAAGLSGHPSDVDTSRGPGFTDASMVLQAAVEGQGVALGRSALAGNDLEAGRLVLNFTPANSTHNRYYLVYPLQHAERPKLRQFRDWLLEETAAERDGR